MADASLPDGRQNHADSACDVAPTIMLGAVPPGAEAPGDAIRNKGSHCGCCEAHTNHLRAHGFDVTVMPSTDLATKRLHGVPGALDLRLAQADLPGRAPVGAAVAIQGETVK